MVDKEKLKREQWAINVTMNWLKDCPQSKRVHPEYEEYLRTMTYFTERLKEIDKKMKDP